MTFAVKFLVLSALLLGACASHTDSKPAADTRTPSQINSAGELKTSLLDLKYGKNNLLLRVGVQEPVGEVVGDVIYVHGFADRLDNHGPLFRAWNEAGLRVIAFDLPSHGDDAGTYNNLNKFSFKELAELVVKVEQATKPETARPLLLAGWSTGGLILVRAMQESWLTGLSRKVKGVVLFAPGVSVRKFPWTFGNRMGQVTQETLTHDPKPPHVAAIDPASPFWSKLALKFAPRLVAESVLAQHAMYPYGLPTLVFTGGDQEDMYAKSPEVKKWVEKQNKTIRAAGQAPIINLVCEFGRHELDNELPVYGGNEVKNSAAQFAHDVAVNDAASFKPGSQTYGIACKER